VTAQHSINAVCIHIKTNKNKQNIKHSWVSYSGDTVQVIDEGVKYRKYQCLHTVLLLMLPILYNFTMLHCPYTLNVWLKSKLVFQMTHTHTHTQPFYCCSGIVGTTRVSRYQKTDIVKMILLWHLFECFYNKRHSNNKSFKRKNDVMDKKM